MEVIIVILFYVGGIWAIYSMDGSDGLKNLAYQIGHFWLAILLATPIILLIYFILSD